MRRMQARSVPGVWQRGRGPRTAENHEPARKLVRCRPMTDLSAFPITRKWPAAHPERLQLYSLPTPNGVKVSILLEETGLPYEVHRVDFGQNDQTTPEFLSLNPNNKIPAIIDPHGPEGTPLALWESGAILVYLASKSGQLLPRDTGARYETLQWLMFQMGGIGPMFGQNHHFQKAAPEKLPYAIKRCVDETRRLFGVMDKRLAEFPNLSRWHDAIAARPAVQRGMAIPN